MEDARRSVLAEVVQITRPQGSVQSFPTLRPHAAPRHTTRRRATQFGATPFCFALRNWQLAAPTDKGEDRCRARQLENEAYISYPWNCPSWAYADPGCTWYNCDDSVREVETWASARCKPSSCSTDMPCNRKACKDPDGGATLIANWINSTQYNAKCKTHNFPNDCKCPQYDVNPGTSRRCKQCRICDPVKEWSPSSTCTVTDRVCECAPGYHGIASNRFDKTSSCVSCSDASTDESTCQSSQCRGFSWTSTTKCTENKCAAFRTDLEMYIENAADESLSEILCSDGQQVGSHAPLPVVSHPRHTHTRD